jgi:hypothetical protein
VPVRLIHFAALLLLAFGTLLVLSAVSTVGQPPRPPVTATAVCAIELKKSPTPASFACYQLVVSQGYAMCADPRSTHPDWLTAVPRAPECDP